MHGKQKTFAVALSRQMAPSAHIVAYCIVQGEVVTDALSFYVHDTRLMQVLLTVRPFNRNYLPPVTNPYFSLLAYASKTKSHSKTRRFDEDVAYALYVTHDAF